MPIDPRIPMMGRPIQLNSPLNMLARVQGIDNMRQTNALNAMQMQDAQAQRAAQAQQAQAMERARAEFPDPPEDAPPQLKMAVRAFKAGLAPFSGVIEASKPQDRKLTVVGRTAIDPNTGAAVYSEPAAPGKAPSAVQEYEYAKGQGYRGSFRDWTTEKARAGASSTSVSYGAPVAGVDASGNPVFFQPDKKGGNPAIIPGVSPPKPTTPAAMQEKLAQNAVTLSKIDKALLLLDERPDSLGVKNYLGDPIMQRVDPDGVNLRAMIADIGGQKIHDRSGAAVTVGEAERLKPYIPAATDTPKAAKKKLRLFRQEYASMQQAIQSGASIAQAAGKVSADSPIGVVNFADLK